MRSRRDFLRQLALVTAGTGLLPATPLFGATSRRRRTVTILHTNDTHARLDPFPTASGTLAGLGGIARRASLIRQIRAEQEHVLLLDAGDVFQGTPYFNYYSAEPDFRAMSRMGYDAMALGNHEFDNTVEGFMKMTPFAEFPFLCANYDFGSSPMADVVKPTLIKECDGIRIGIIGIGVNLAGLVLPTHHAGVSFMDPVRWADYHANRLRYREGCHYVIALTHHGHRTDVDLAGKTTSIDLIIGGHSHTFLEKPEIHANKHGKPVMVTQVGHGGVVLGRLDVHFDDQARVEAAIARNGIIGDADWQSLV
jgi:5'-nucleotidase